MLGPKGLVGGLFAIIGALFLVLSLSSLAQGLWLRVKGERAEGVIIGWGSCGRYSHCPVALFTDISGKQHQAVSSVGIGRSSSGLSKIAYENGDKVAIAYPAGHPEQARFVSNGSQLIMVFIALFASAFVALGIWIIRNERKEMRQDGWII